PGSGAMRFAGVFRWSWARKTSCGGIYRRRTRSSSTAKSTRCPRTISRELSLGERIKMELIASLLHKPQLLLLDEPTIGLDVIAQVTIQKCLKEYNRRRGVTVLLTSHYMRDVEALCKRVLVITHGKLVYDGPLAGIADRFGRHKQVKLQFDGEPPTGLEAFGEIAGREGP